MSTRIRIAGAGESWGPPTPRTCPALSGNVRPRAVTERRGNVLFIPSGRQGFGKRRGREDTLQSRAKLLHSPRTLSRTKATSPITSGRRAPRSFTTSFLAESAARPRKARRTSERGASLWCSRQMRQGIRVAFWQYDSTTASKPCVYMYIFIYFLGRNRVIENPRSLVALVFE